MTYQLDYFLSSSNKKFETSTGKLIYLFSQCLISVLQFLETDLISSSLDQFAFLPSQLPVAGNKNRKR
jgi:hypothetical protein